MPNVVLDASSLVGVLLRPGSVPEQAFLLAKTVAGIAMSPDIESELRDVFGQKKFKPYVTPERARAVLLSLLSEASFFQPTIPVTDCRDPKDNKYLELALAAGAAVIVSSDADLLVLHPWRGIDILTLAEFVARFT